MKVLICGDICPTSDYIEFFNNPKELLNDVVDLIKKSDYAVCNLECPATNTTDRIIKTGPSLKAMPHHIKVLKSAGFNAFSLANNHILDYGVKGLFDTLQLADDDGIATFGAGENIDEAKKPLFVKIKDKNIGFMSFAEHEFNIATADSPGANLFDPYTSLKEIEAARKKCDFLIVLYHGGIEHFKYPTPLLQKKCRVMVDFGADIVLCQHSHCIGTYEQYKDATILYGQGNCVFGHQEGDDNWNEGIIVELDIDEKIKVNYHLIRASKSGVSLIYDNDRMNNFFMDSERISDTAFLKNKFAQFCKNRTPLDLPLFYAKNRLYIRLNRMFKGKLFKLKKKNIMITHNLIRCDAWNEVMQEIFNSIFKES